LLDKHEGAGTWAAALGSLLVIIAAFVVPARERRIAMKGASLKRLVIISSNYAVHGCIQVIIRYDPEVRSRSYFARVKIKGPDGARLLEGIRTKSPGVHNTIFGIGKVELVTELDIRLDWRSSDPTADLSGAFYVAGNGPNNDWTIKEADVSLEIRASGYPKPVLEWRELISPLVD